jgi:hypothetical protein
MDLSTLRDPAAVCGVKPYFSMKGLRLNESTALPPGCSHHSRVSTIQLKILTTLSRGVHKSSQNIRDVRAACNTLMSIMDSLRHDVDSAATLNRAMINFHISLGILGQDTQRLINQCSTCEAQLQPVETAAQAAQSGIHNSECVEMQQAMLINVHQEVSAVALEVPPLMQLVRDVSASASTIVRSMDQCLPRVETASTLRTHLMQLQKTLVRCSQGESRDVGRGELPLFEPDLWHSVRVTEFRHCVCLHFTACSVLSGSGHRPTAASWINFDRQG